MNWGHQAISNFCLPHRWGCKPQSLEWNLIRLSKKHTEDGEAWIPSDVPLHSIIHLFLGILRLTIAGGQKCVSSTAIAKIHPLRTLKKTP